MKVSKGLEFPVVAPPGVGHMPAKRENDEEAARVLYVAAMWAMQSLVIGILRTTRIAKSHITTFTYIAIQQSIHQHLCI